MTNRHFFREDFARVTYVDRHRVKYGDEQFALAIELMATVCSAIPYGWNEAPVRHNGTVSDILEKVESGAKFVCGTHQSVFHDACVLSGLEARKITLIRDHSEDPDPKNPWSWFVRHQVVEVNINTPPNFLARNPGESTEPGSTPQWVLFDPTNNQYFMDKKTGHSLSALDVHERWIRWQRNDTAHFIQAVQGSFRPPIPNEPAFGLQDGRWQEIVSAQDIMEIYRDLDACNHLLYYDRLYFLPSRSTAPTIGVVNEFVRPVDRHWGQPLEKTVGPYAYTQDPVGILYDGVRR